jgi:hypothetical protein
VIVAVHPGAREPPQLTPRRDGLAEGVQSRRRRAGHQPVAGRTAFDLDEQIDFGARIAKRGLDTPEHRERLRQPQTHRGELRHALRIDQRGRDGRPADVEDLFEAARIRM